MLIALGPASAALPHVPVLDEPIEAASYAGREGDRFLTVTEIDTGHPAMRSVERFEGVKFYQAIRVTAVEIAGAGAVVNDQTPLVLERQMGEGKVLVFASTFDNECQRSADASGLGAVRPAIGRVPGRRRRGTAGESDGGFLCRAEIGG